MLATIEIIIIWVFIIIVLMFISQLRKSGFYNEGREAYKNGVELYENPHLMFSVDWQEWQDGWLREERANDK